MRVRMMGLEEGRVMTGRAVWRGMAWWAWAGSVNVLQQEKRERQE